MVTPFAQWPQWLQTLILVPHGLLGWVMLWLWWPKNDRSWRKFGFCAAYLAGFFLVMKFVFKAW
jgi:hypothetical protein